ncbi:MAG TPA: hypothetical protein VGW10_08945 [Solirubrobacteraceae bacterium]|nr:hypothetical protein [Solirubrobacteraceae bacterium]
MLGSARTWAAAALVATWAMAPAAAAQEPVTAAGTTVIEGSQPSMTRIVLPKDVTLRTGEANGRWHGQAFLATGDGRHLGFVLRPAGAPSDDLRAVAGHLVNGCFTAGCAPLVADQWITVSGLGEPPDGTYTLPAGTYDLYLLTDGKPARIELKLGGLDGTTTVSPSKAVSATTVSPASTTPPGAGAGPVAYGGGAGLPIGEPGGYLFSATQLVGQGPGSGSIGVCIYLDGPPADGNYHTCRGADSPYNFPFTVAPDEDNAKIVLGALAAAHDGFAIGNYVDGAMARWSAGAVSVGLTFAQPTPLPPGTPPAPDAPPRNDAGPTPPALANPQVSGGGSEQQRNDRTPCRPTVRAKRTRAGATLTARADETCRVAAKLVRRGRTIARATTTLAPGRTRKLTLRTKRSVRGAKVVVETTDAAGNRARRTIRVR